MKVNQVRPTIERMKEAGYKVMVAHCRPVEGVPEGNYYDRKTMKDLGFRPAPSGGACFITVDAADSKQYLGEAMCSPRDTYCYRLGTAIALGRVTHAMKMEGYTW